MIYFDNGATTFPKPEGVIRAMEEALTRYGANPGRSGHQMSMETAIRVFEAREAAGRLFGVENPEEVVFTANCTHAVNIAIKGLVRQGDHVILSDLEHNAVLRPVHALAEQGVITYDVAETYPDPWETVHSFRALVRPNTRLIACTHASNVFGIRLPIEELGMFCQEEDFFFLVDAAQTAGVLEIDAPEWGIDFLCTAGHKGMYGPAGTGLLITALGSKIGTLMEGGTGSFSMDYQQPVAMPDRMESGTVNTPGILGLGAGLAFLEERGCAAIYRHEMSLAQQIVEELQKLPEVMLYTPRFGMNTHLPVISFNLRGMVSEEVTDQLSQMGFALRGGLHCAPLAHRKMGTTETGTARISVGAFNTQKEAEQLCAAIKKLCRYS